MTKGILIDPHARTITEIDFESRADFCRLLNCQSFDFAQIALHNDVLVIDDEGLFAPNPAYWRWLGLIRPMVNSAILIGPVDAEGEIKGITVSLEELHRMVRWATPADWQAWIDEHGDEAAVSINGQTIQTWAALELERQGKLRPAQEEPASEPAPSRKRGKAGRFTT